MNTNQMIQAARIVIEGGSTDAARASMRILKAGQDFAQAHLIMLFEKAQQDLTKELARLTDRDLVTYHTEAALERVSRILHKLRTDTEPVIKSLVNANVIGGKVGSRLKSGGDPVTAMSLSRGDETRSQRIVEQLIGQIYHATTCAEQALRSKVTTASAAAFIPRETTQSAPVLSDAENYPSITQNSGFGESFNPYGNETGLTNKDKGRLKDDPLKTAAEMARDAYKSIAGMKQRYVIGRREMDVLRRRTLEQVASNEAVGGGMPSAQKSLLNSILKDGVVAFTDRGGHKWDLPSYCSMAVRTTSRQAQNFGELYEDEEHDLYWIVDNGSNCPICSRYEGRVYSRSGTHPVYPPLSKAFGKIDPNGSDSLENTYMNIHPNCRHVLTKFNERAYKPEKLEEIQKKSNPETNPFEDDPRTEEQIKDYKERERLMGKRATALRKFREFAQFIPYNQLGAFPKFEKEFNANSEKYQKWEKVYKEKLAGRNKT